MSTVLLSINVLVSGREYALVLKQRCEAGLDLVHEKEGWRGEVKKLMEEVEKEGEAVKDAGKREELKRERDGKSRNWRRRSRREKGTDRIKLEAIERGREEKNVMLEQGRKVRQPK